MDVVAPGFEYRRHLVGAVAEHALELGTEEQDTGGNIPVPQAVSGLVEGKPELLLPAWGAVLLGHPAGDVPGNRQKIAPAIKLEMGGIDLHGKLIPLLMAVPTDEAEAIGAAYGRGNLGPLGQPMHIHLQAEHTVVQHILAAQAEAFPCFPIAPHDAGRFRINEIDRVRKLIEQHFRRG
jgi:hypothetical protein